MMLTPVDTLTGRPAQIGGQVEPFRFEWYKVTRRWFWDIQYSDLGKKMEVEKNENGATGIR